MGKRWTTLIAGLGMVCAAHGAEPWTIAREIPEPMQREIGELKAEMAAKAADPLPSIERYATESRFDELTIDQLDSLIANLDNTSGGIAWGTSYLMEGLNAMYRVTGDRKYLDALRKTVNAVLAARDDRQGLKLWDGSVAPIWGIQRFEHGRTAHTVNTGMITYPMLDYLLQAKGNAAFMAELGGEWQVTLDAVLESVNFHNRQWKDGPAEGEGYYYYLHQNPVFDGRPLPINRSNAMGRALWTSWKLTGNQDHRDKALRIGRYLKNRLAVYPDGAYYWSYVLPEQPVEGPIPLDQIDRGSEDISHATITLALPVMLYEDGEVFTDEDMRRFGRTVTEGFGRMAAEGVLFEKIAGPPWSEPGAHIRRGRWLRLGHGAPEAYELLSEYYRRYAPKPDDLTIALMLAYRPEGTPAAR